MGSLHPAVRLKRLDVGVTESFSSTGETIYLSHLQPHLSTLKRLSITHLRAQIERIVHGRSDHTAPNHRNVVLWPWYIQPCSYLPITFKLAYARACIAAFTDRLCCFLVAISTMLLLSTRLAR